MPSYAAWVTPIREFECVTRKANTVWNLQREAYALALDRHRNDSETFLVFELSTD